VPACCFIILLLNGCSQPPNAPYEGVGQSEVIPIPKEQELKEGRLTFKDTISYYAEHDNLNPLYGVLKEELRSLYNIILIMAPEESSADIFTTLDTSLEAGAYQVNVDERIEITGGTYDAVAMGSVTVLQISDGQNASFTIPEGTINDYPDLEFRGLLIDVARRKHSIEVLKQVVSLCRWYKLNYLQLHLTDEKYFTFPSLAYPQLSSGGFHFTRQELAELVDFADVRGVELIPELEVPGHAGQFVEQMPEVFGFKDESLNRHTINMARDSIYPVLETLIAEIADIFDSSEYIHIGGDEADFKGMAEDPEVQQYLQSKGLDSVEELFWHFINRMNQIVKSTGKKAIVWEGFSKEGNAVVSKDITVMAWETMYQLPQDLLNAGYKVINVSWKPLYVVNNRKWSPEEIYEWDVYTWQNWYPKTPSFKTIHIEEHPNLLGAAMASWAQPEYIEISSTRLRVPAMVERVWNKNPVVSYNEFENRLQKTDAKLDRFFSPVIIEEEGLSYPDIKDGRKQEQTWFGDTLTISLNAPEGLRIHFTTNGTKVTQSSPVYNKPIKISETTTLKYKAYTLEGEAVGHEILKYYNLNPLKIELTGGNLISTDSLWKTTEPWRIPFYDSIRISISSDRRGEIRYTIESNGLKTDQVEYEEPFVLKETALVKAGLYVDDTLTGNQWVQHFKNIDEKL
jgi:hexosaminidase